MRHKILYCAVDKLAETLDSDEVVGWRVLAILPQSYKECAPSSNPQQQIQTPAGAQPSWEYQGWIMAVTTFPTLTLTTVTIILES